MANQRGALSAEDMDYIARNYEIMSAEEIAEHLGRTVDLIKKKISQLPRRQRMLEQVDLVAQLRGSPLWAEIKKTLLPGEVAIFETQWASLVNQFSAGGEILATDEIMIRDLISSDIAARRAEKDKMKCLNFIEELEALVDKEMKLPEDQRNNLFVANARDQILQSKAAIHKLTETHMGYQKQKNDLMDELKATRKARFKENVEKQHNFFVMLSELDTLKARQREGRIAEKVKIAAQRVKQELNEVTEYEDGTTDKPFLSPEGELQDG